MDRCPPTLQALTVGANLIAIVAMILRSKTWIFQDMDRRMNRGVTTSLEELAEEPGPTDLIREADVMWEVGRWRAAAAQNAELYPVARLFVPKNFEQLAVARGEEMAHPLWQAKVEETSVCRQRYGGHYLLS